MALSSPASAEIYQTKDAQGNTVYSDKPSQGAQPVNLQKTNSADPVVEMPRPAETAAPPAPKKVATRPAKKVQSAEDENDGHYHDNYDYYGYGNNNDDDDNPRENRRDDENSRPGKDRPTVTPHRSVSRPAAGGGGRR
jgi:hypothetical protein